MTRQDAEAMREDLSESDPGSTYIVAGDDAGGWKVVKIGMAPSESGEVPTTEERPRPPHPDDTRSGHEQRAGSTWAGLG